MKLSVEQILIIFADLAGKGRVIYTGQCAKMVH